MFSPPDAYEATLENASCICETSPKSHSAAVLHAGAGIKRNDERVSHDELTRARKGQPTAASRHRPH